MRTHSQNKSYVNNPLQKTIPNYFMKLFHHFTLLPGKKKSFFFCGYHEVCIKDRSKLVLMNYLLYIVDLGLLITFFRIFCIGFPE